jgi:hypothetical protein
VPGTGEKGGDTAVFMGIGILSSPVPGSFPEWIIPVGMEKHLLKIGSFFAEKRPGDPGQRKTVEIRSFPVAFYGRIFLVIFDIPAAMPLGLRAERRAYLWAICPVCPLFTTDLFSQIPLHSPSKPRAGGLCMPSPEHARALHHLKMASHGAAPAGAACVF